MKKRRKKNTCGKHEKGICAKMHSLQITALNKINYMLHLHKTTSGPPFAMTKIGRTRKTANTSIMNKSKNHCPRYLLCKRIRRNYVYLNVAYPFIIFNATHIRRMCTHQSILLQIHSARQRCCSSTSKLAAKCFAPNRQPIERKMMH